jgi:hypothetical protein
LVAYDEAGEDVGDREQPLIEGGPTFDPRDPAALAKLIKAAESVPRLTRAEEVALAGRLADGDRDAVGRLLEANVFLILSRVERYVARGRALGLTSQDLFRAAYDRLARDLASPRTRYDGTTTFSTYAVIRIDGAIKDACAAVRRGAKLGPEVACPEDIEARLLALPRPTLRCYYCLDEYRLGSTYENASPGERFDRAMEWWHGHDCESVLVLDPSWEPSEGWRRGRLSWKEIEDACDADVVTWMSIEAARSAGIDYFRADSSGGEDIYVRIRPPTIPEARVRHGLSGYRRGCRCDVCKAANAAKQRRRRARRRTTRDEYPRRATSSDTSG